jgi:hypothetical protein
MAPALSRSAGTNTPELHRSQSFIEDIDMNALTTTTTLTPFDGFEYDDGEARSGAIYGKFDCAAIHKWHGRDGALESLGPHIAANLFPENLKWSGKKVVDRTVPEAGKPLPEVDKLNAAIPVKDWEEDFNGNPKGPWARNYTVHLVDPKTGAKIIVSNSTVGMRIAYQELKERTQFMRKFRGENVYPEVMLSEAQMRTSFGMKLRPHFEIVGWRAFGAPSAPDIAGPTASEIVNDEIPDHSAPFNDGIPDNL